MPKVISTRMQKTLQWMWKCDKGTEKLITSKEGTMKKRILKFLAVGYFLLLLALPCSMPVHAETVSGNDAGVAVQANSGITAWEVTADDGVTFKVTYPDVISCGEPVTFLFETTDVDGAAVPDTQYRIHSLFAYDGSEYVSVYDVSYGSNSAYSTNETWNFTFYASGTYYIRFNASYKGADDTLKYADTGSLDRGIVLNINDSAYPSVETIVQNVADECQAKCSTDFDKAVWLNDWLVDNCEYDDTYSYCSAEGALARGNGTCEAYHRAYVMLLNKVGIPAGRIIGNGHVWTAVKLDGKWYQVDTTWNDARYEDPNVDLKHLYFGLNDAITSLVHSDHRPVAGYESDSLENNYFIKMGQIAKWADPQKAVVQQHIDAGETNFALEIQNTTYADVLYSLVAYDLTNTSWSTGGQEVNLKAEYIPKTLPDGQIDSSNGVISCTVQNDTDTGGNGDDSGSSGGDGGSDNENDGGDSGNSGGNGGSGGSSGWTGGGSTFKNGRKGVTVYKGVDYSSVFNFEYYVSRYADIKRAFGDNERAVLNHFLTYGMKEGRSAHENFDVLFYRSYYPDLQRAFGNDLKSYFYHYLKYGINERRVTVPQ